MIITSIIINYNNEKFIADAIDSINKQTLLPNELIIVDDASTDKSTQKITEAIKKLTLPVKFITHPENKGAAAARNTAINAAQGDILAFLDGDDIYYKDKIKRSLEYMIKYPKVGMVYSDYDVQENGKIHREYARSFDLMLLKDDCLPNSNSLIRKSVFQEAGLFNESLRGAEDYDMWLRIATRTQIIHIPEALFLYRMHGDNFTVKHTQEVINNTKRIRHALKSS